jgi:DNA-directed RNA polymerase subunit H (RpoH/RPB5)
MDFDTVDILFRSRQTILEILKAKGYDTTPYERFGPFEVELMASGKLEKSLRMDLAREVPEGSGAPAYCRVEYAIPKVKNRLAGFLNNLLTDPETGDPLIDSATTEVMVITLESVGGSFTAAALKQWSATKLRIAFFDAHTLISNPLEHVLVPKHELVPQEEQATLLKRLNCTSKMNLPQIKFHEDIIGRLLGLVPGDIVKITRPSPQAGSYVVYRVCVP